MEAELNAWVWLGRVFWALALAGLLALAIWTLVRTPGRGQDPGLRSEEAGAADDPPRGGGTRSGDDDGSWGHGGTGDDEPWRGG